MQDAAITAAGRGIRAEASRICGLTREIESMQVRTEAVEPSVTNPLYLWLICLVAALGGLLFGYDWVVIGGAKEFLRNVFLGT